MAAFRGVKRLGGIGFALNPRSLGRRVSLLHLVVDERVQSRHVIFTGAKTIGKQSGIDREHEGSRSLAEWTWSQQVEHKVPRLMHQVQSLFCDYVQTEPELIRSLCDYVSTIALHHQCEPLSVTINVRKFPASLSGIWMDESSSDDNGNPEESIEGRIKRRRLNGSIVQYRCARTNWL